MNRGEVDGAEGQAGVSSICPHVDQLFLPLGNSKLYEKRCVCFVTITFLRPGTKPGPEQVLNNIC